MLNLIGADWRPIFVDYFDKVEPRTPEYRAKVNEMGEVPVLAHGERKLSQSAVCLTYLAARFGKFQPQGEDERLEALRWIIFDNQKVGGFLGPYRYLRSLAPTPGDPAVLAFLKRRLDNSLAIVDKRLAAHPFILGDRPTIADVSMCGYMYYPAEEIRIRSPRGLRQYQRLARSPPGAAGLEAPLRPYARTSDPPLRAFCRLRRPRQPLPPSRCRTSPANRPRPSVQPMAAST